MHVCQRCGKENQEHYKFCLGCGGEIGDAPSVPPGASEFDAHSATALVNSASDVTDPARMAAPAGRSSAPPVGLGASPPLLGEGAPDGGRLCPTCGTFVPHGFVFCGQCGSRVDGRPASAAPPPPLAAGGPRGKLLLIRPDGTEGGSHPLSAGPNAIGRSTSSLFEADSYLSPNHAELIVAGGTVTVRDLGSLNGVFARISDEEQIADGEVFRIGQELLRFDVMHSPEALPDGTEVMGSPNPGYWGRVALIVGRDQDGSAFPLFGDAIVLGRERGDILFPEDGYVSGTHARLSTRDGRFFLADMNSSNGTFIRIRGQRQLRTGTFLLMGQQLFRLQV